MASPSLIMLKTGIIVNYNKELTITTLGSKWHTHIAKNKQPLQHFKATREQDKRNAIIPPPAAPQQASVSVQTSGHYRKARL